ncbi:hypothetical protein DdX_02072 [Ditylenchus destructor]|uniref:Lebercilin domain-containing protein n=1 Tax=Ditylenchus destructor TaxID=166010 RepID=A0AAD4NDH0_9BILA|nr:hypothetical protein DdX_02072 [Ditylenchus destructor]
MKSSAKGNPKRLKQHSYSLDRLSSNRPLVGTNTNGTAKPNFRPSASLNNRKDFLPPPILGSHASADRFSRSPYLTSVNDLRDELLKTKRAYSLALRENSFIRTKFKISEKECKKKEKEIMQLLSTDQNNTSRYEERLQLNSLKKKAIQYERVLRNKIEENAKLLSDRNVAKAAESRHLVEKLEAECNRLRNHLSQSIPEGEFLREKHQYMEIIDRLTEENMDLRRIIGEYEKQQRDDLLSEHICGKENYMNDLEALPAKTYRKQMEHYKTALSALIKQRRSRSAVLIRSHSDSRRQRKSTSTLSETQHRLSSPEKERPKRSISQGEAIAVHIPTRGRQQIAENKCRKNLEYKATKSLDDGWLEKPIMELKTQNASMKPPFARMYHDISSASSRSTADSEVILVGNGGQDLTKSFLIDEEGHVFLRDSQGNTEQDRVIEEGEDHLIIHMHGSGRNMVETTDKNETPDTITSDEVEQNIQSLNMEFGDELCANESEKLLEKVFTYVQSHILRVKMIKIRQENLNQDPV